MVVGLGRIIIGSVVGGVLEVAGLLSVLAGVVAVEVAVVVEAVAVAVAGVEVEAVLLPTKQTSCQGT